MSTKLRAVLLAVLLQVPLANAEVTDADAGGFTTVNEEFIGASRDLVWQVAISDVGKWWNADHTVSGDASRLRITAAPQGCFCENLGEGAGVVHLTVTMVNPSVVLRMTGGLGPLGLMGLAGNLTWEFDDADKGTRVRFTYAVGGYSANGLDALATPVDAVIADALARLKSHIETGYPVDADVE